MTMDLDSTRLLSVEEAEQLGIEQVWDLYRSHVNASQVELIGSFSFGRELVDSASGCYITLRSGRRILDMTGGIGVLNHGHNHPRILETRRRFEERSRMEVHKNFFSPYTAALSANVANVMPGDLTISYFPNSGAEAVEGALKMAFKYHDGARSTVLHSDISFHGKLLGAATLTGSPELHFRFPGIPGTDSFEYGRIESVEAAIARHRKADGSSDIYAIIVEPLNASSMRTCSPEFLLRLRDLCTREGIVLVFDEVYTGWGKTGTLFNFMRVPDLLPDIITYAKSFGGGKASISGYTAREPIARQAYDNLRDATLHSTTYYGFGEEMATAITAINIIVEDDLVGRSAAIGERLGTGLRSLQAKHSEIKDVRGSGALWGLILDSKLAQAGAAVLDRIPALSGPTRDPQLGNKLLAGAIISHLYDEHGILTYFGSNVENPLILSFPLIAEDSDIDYALAALDQTLSRGVSRLAVAFAQRKFSGPKAKA